MDAWAIPPSIRPDRRTRTARHGGVDHGNGSAELAATPQMPIEIGVDRVAEEGIVALPVSNRIGAASLK